MYSFAIFADLVLPDTPCIRQTKQSTNLHIYISGYQIKNIVINIIIIKNIYIK